MRQDTTLWKLLHQGVLTTGQLNAALGFYEPQAAQKLGIPSERVHHGALLTAWQNLQQPVYVPEPQAVPPYQESYTEQQYHQQQGQQAAEFHYQQPQQQQATQPVLAAGKAGAPHKTLAQLAVEQGIPLVTLKRRRQRERKRAAKRVAAGAVGGVREYATDLPSELATWHSSDSLQAPLSAAQINKSTAVASRGKHTRQLYALPFTCQISACIRPAAVILGY